MGNLSAKRDFTDVRDVVRAYVIAASKGQGIYNLGTGVALSIQEILDRLLILGETECEVKVKDDLFRTNDLPILSSSFDKAKIDLGWSPEISLDSTLNNILRFWEAKV